jgi:hypothetical protein
MSNLPLVLALRAESMRGENEATEGQHDMAHHPGLCRADSLGGVSASPGSHFSSWGELLLRSSTSVDTGRVLQVFLNPLHGTFEFPDPLPQTLPKLREFFRTKEEKHDQDYHEQF